MAVKQKTAPKKIKSEPGTSPGALRKIARNEANLSRHERNLKLAKAFDVDPSKKGFRKLVKKAVDEQNKWVREIFDSPLPETKTQTNKAWNKEWDSKNSVGAMH